MDGFQKRKEAKTRAILKSALSLYMQKGLQDTTVAEIAADAGVSKVTIFNYFGTKENLVREVVLHYITEVYEEFHTIVHSNLSFETKLEKMMFLKSSEMEHSSSEFINEIMEEYNREDSRIRELYDREGLELYMNLFLQGKNEGKIHGELTIEAMMVYLSIFSEGLRQKSVYSAVIPYTKEVMELFMYGLAGNK